ncbi:hypothetical protein HY643_02695 [Candidatus Woesearchaeota archaeon]|nr:hypothetical protein [Candidatus Woesearchaeota archaeon]
MSLNFIKQNAKTLIECSYLYDRLVKEGKKGEIENLEKYVLELTKTIREEAAKERVRDG